MDWLILYKVFKEVTLKVTHTGGMSHIVYLIFFFNSRNYRILELKGNDISNDKLYKDTFPAQFLVIILKPFNVFF